MAFKKYQGRGFNLFIEGPAGTDGRKRETTVVSCRAEDYPEVLETILQGEGWIKQDDSLAKAQEAVHLYVRPSCGKKNFTLRVVQSDYLRTVFWVPDQETSEASLMPGKDARKFLD